MADDAPTPAPAPVAVAAAVTPAAVAVTTAPASAKAPSTAEVAPAAAPAAAAAKTAPLAEAEDLGAGAPEQVLAAGGVSRRRRGATAGGKRRSPSGGARRRAPTPEPPRHPPLEDEEDEELYSSVSPSASSSAAVDAAAPAARPPTPPVTEEPKAKPRRRLKDKEKAKRSLSSPGDDRVALVGDVPPTVLKTYSSETDGTRTETIVMQSKREFKVERVELPAEIKMKSSLSPAKEAPAKLMSTLQSKPRVQEVEIPPDEEIPREELDKEVEEILKQCLAERPEEEPEPIKSEEPKQEEPKQEEPKKSFIPYVPWRTMLRNARPEWKAFKQDNPEQYNRLVVQRNRCASALLLMIIYCGLGGMVFRFTEGAFEAFYKCGVKRVKRNFVDDLWLSSHHMREEDWKSQARKKLMEFENQLHTAHEAGVTSYSGQRSWSFLNAVVYCLTVVTTIGYGHLSPSTTTGRAITIVYAIFGIPLFLILLADFGKLFTRGIKFLWAFVRRLYYTGSCRKVRRTVPVQEVMKGVQLVYNFANFRRPSQVPPGEGPGEECDVQTPLNQQPPPQVQIHEPSLPPEDQNIPLDGREPSTPVPSVFEVDDEFNLPISIAITILLTYIFVGAAVYYIWEDWGFFESFYFVFISMSTIGFGDFVPQHPMYMMASIVYLVFGLALTSMCINVVQEKLSDSFRQASAKIGATIGLRVQEEDGNITPVTPQNIQPEEADVVPSMTKSAST